MARAADFNKASLFPPGSGLAIFSAPSTISRGRHPTSSTSISNRRMFSARLSGFWEFEPSMRRAPMRSIDTRSSLSSDFLIFADEALILCRLHLNR
jgi:hypothetical protein